jgi:hypothetical protein
MSKRAATPRRTMRSALSGWSNRPGVMSCRVKQGSVRRLQFGGQRQH